MSSYKEPSFQERTALAKKAKQDALDKLRAKPPIDDATLAARREAARIREVKQATARDEKLAARAQEKAQKRDRADQNVPDATGSSLTRDEQKAARDAKYAARKNRKK